MSTFVKLLLAALAATFIGFIPNDVAFTDPTGQTATDSLRGNIDLTNEFFQDLGGNGRRCVSCHLPSAGWTITPSQVQAVFAASAGGVTPDGAGLSAIFRTGDGANSPDADVSTLAARTAAYSMLLTKGLIRVGLSIPAAGDFDLTVVDDPYGHASAADVSLFRRPLPTTNLKFLGSVMWDGRETFAGESIQFDLADAANSEAHDHAVAVNPLTLDQRNHIVDFETALATAAVFDNNAKNLTVAGADGGPQPIQTQVSYPGINDNFGDSQTGAPFNSVVFSIYDAWAGSGNPARAAVARGQALFNTRTIDIRGVGGINDNPAFGSPSLVLGTCTTCHNAPNGGSHSTVFRFNTGVVEASRRTPDLPLYTLACNANGIARGHCAIGDTRMVTDIGRAMISGNWIDIGKLKVPTLRGLAARPPYFHNGSAATLGDVVDFYNNRFNMQLTAQERSDLIAFLQTL